MTRIQTSNRFVHRKTSEAMTTISTLLKTSEAMRIAKTILHPTDFTPNSDNAFICACSLARDNKARLILLHVIPRSVDPIMQVLSPYAVQPPESQEAWKEGFPWPQPFDSLIVAEHRVAKGDVAEEIFRLAKVVNCDLIVMGTHGRTGLRRLLMGSVAEEVLRNAACPVVAVKAPLPYTLSCGNEKAGEAG
jgi:nucleotide-binding universal stress UspA family protein